MTRIYMVRHGKAAAGWDADTDPALDETGQGQAERVAEYLDAEVGRAPIFSSPLRRCRETAAPLAARWGVEVEIEPRVAEIPSPTSDLQERGVWLRRVMGGSWDELAADSNTHDYAAWMRGVGEGLLARAADVPAIVVFSHFIALNAALNIATGAGGKGAMMAFRPDNASVSVFAVSDGNLTLIEAGTEAATHVG